MPEQNKKLETGLTGCFRNLNVSTSLTALQLICPMSCAWMDMVCMVLTIYIYSKLG